MDSATLKYSKTHEWIGLEGSVYVVGISDHAVHQLGDITYVELPAVGTAVDKDGEVATVESVKAASEIYSPVAGTVAEVNSALEGQPELLNESPYEAGWLFKLTDVDPAALDELLDEAAYKAFAAEEDAH